jgi:hypothetical protein
VSRLTIQPPSAGQDNAKLNREEVIMAVLADGHIGLPEAVREVSQVAMDLAQQAAGILLMACEPLGSSEPGGQSEIPRQIGQSGCGAFFVEPRGIAW